MNISRFSGGVIVERGGALFKCRINPSFRPVTSNLSAGERARGIVSVGQEVVSEELVANLVA